MIKSMTGFGRAEITANNRKFTVEIKSVNHRYLDINIKMPKKISFFENDVRNYLKKDIHRGKVDLFITYEDYQDDNILLRYNRDLAKEYCMHVREMAAEFGLEDDLKASTLARFPEVLTMEEQDIDEDQLWAVLESALKEASTQFVASRVAEGEHLKKDLLEKLDAMASYVDFIEERSPMILAEYKSRLESKVQDILSDRQMDEGRIAAEVVLYADKICVDEETVRLESHIQAMKDAIQDGGSIGRKLDFIAQELNREANTILSKTTDLAIADVGIDLKTEIEKVREQIQNIE